MSTKGVVLRRYTDQEMAVISDRSIPAREAAEGVGLAVSTVYNLRHLVERGLFAVSDWTEVEADFIIENIEAMTTAQIAAYLGRDLEQVKTEIIRLQRNGAVAKRSLRSKNPSVVADRTLLAKTCPCCGLLLDAKWFGRNRKKRNVWFPNCRRCQTNSAKERKARKRTSTAPYTAKLQAITLERAENHGKEWTEADIKMLADPNKTAFQKALELKRTYIATRTALSNNGFTSQPDWKQLKNGQWRLFWEFDEELKEAS